MNTFDMNATITVNDETSSSIGSVYLPEGVYAFTVTGIPKAGFHNPKHPNGTVPAGAQTRLVTLNIFHPNYPELKGTFEKMLYGHETTKRAIVDFFVSLGMVENKVGAQIAPDWNTTSGREGRVSVKRKTYIKSAAKGGGVGYINEIGYFKAPATELSVLSFTPEDLQRPTSTAPVTAVVNVAPPAPPVVQQAPQAQQAPPQGGGYQQPPQQPQQGQYQAPPQGFNQAPAPPTAPPVQM